MDDDRVLRYDSRETVCVERVVPLWGCFDTRGQVDDADGKWRQRTVEEFATALLAARDGLAETSIEVYDNHGAGELAVCGSRPATELEIAEYDRREHMLWLCAKGTYERGLARWGA